MKLCLHLSYYCSCVAPNDITRVSGSILDILALEVGGRGDVTDHLDQSFFFNLTLMLDLMTLSEIRFTSLTAGFIR